jgi:hypothetical protein
MTFPARLLLLTLVCSASSRWQDAAVSLYFVLTVKVTEFYEHSALYGQRLYAVDGNKLMIEYEIKVSTICYVTSQRNVIFSFRSKSNLVTYLMIL